MEQINKPTMEIEGDDVLAHTILEFEVNMKKELRQQNAKVKKEMEKLAQKLDFLLSNNIGQQSSLPSPTYKAPTRPQFYQSPHLMHYSSTFESEYEFSVSKPPIKPMKLFGAIKPPESNRPKVLPFKPLYGRQPMIYKLTEPPLGQYIAIIPPKVNESIKQPELDDSNISKVDLAKPQQPEVDEAIELLEVDEAIELLEVEETIELLEEAIETSEANETTEQPKADDVAKLPEEDKTIKLQQPDEVSKSIGLTLTSDITPSKSSETKGKQLVGGFGSGRRKK